MDDLKFLKELADEYNLSYFINEKGDLEIRDKNICFHLALVLDVFSYIHLI